MNTAEGSTNGKKLLRMILKTLKTNHKHRQDFAHPRLHFLQSQSPRLSIHLLLLRAGTQLRPLDTAVLIVLSLWQQSQHR